MLRIKYKSGKRKYRNARAFIRGVNKWVFKNNKNALRKVVVLVNKCKKVPKRYSFFYRKGLETLYKPFIGIWGYYGIIYYNTVIRCIYDWFTFNIEKLFSEPFSFSLYMYHINLDQAYMDHLVFFSFQSAVNVRLNQDLDFYRVNRTWWLRKRIYAYNLIFKRVKNVSFFSKLLKGPFIKKLSYFYIKPVKKLRIAGNKGFFFCSHVRKFKYLFNGVDKPFVNRYYKALLYFINKRIYYRFLRRKKRLNFLRNRKFNRRFGKVNYNRSNRLFAKPIVKKWNTL